MMLAVDLRNSSFSPTAEKLCYNERQHIFIYVIL